MSKPYVILVAGGTGGHINAALALGHQLKSENFDIHYLTGTRTLDYKLFKGESVQHFDGKPLREKNPAKLLKNLIKNMLTFLSILKLMVKRKPIFVIGCGGYICGPALVAAKFVGSPIFIFEQNAVLGVTNKILSFISNKIFLHFEKTFGLPSMFQQKVYVVGNPTRQTIMAPTQMESHEELRVLVFGGSLGATQINQMIFDFVQKDSNRPIHVIHQTGQDFEFKTHLGKNIKYQSHKYLDNIQEQYQWCDVIVARAGASTVAELRIIQKPSFLIPYPQATDNHQYFNAQALGHEKIFPVSYVDPKISDQAIYKELVTFLDSAQIKTALNVTKLDLVTVKATKEMKSYVGLSEKQ
jgi:UDP-N-acetylglucosamine--N-acetylmuramyl-(pentapeptide) pyrophosphoryl-undecaprenol N-acetylglucosamine transferase